MTGSRWERLDMLVRERRQRMRLTQADLQQAGGPSPAWLNKLRRNEGPPSTRHARPLRMLDAALRWPPGASWGVLLGALTPDEEARLADGEDEADRLARFVGEQLRAMTPEDAARARRDILATLATVPRGG